jgi:uncharacterized repeat protein (TIGR01451 family)
MYRLRKSLLYIGLSICLSNTFSCFAGECACSSPDPTICAAQSNAPPYTPCTAITSANEYVLRYQVNGARGSMSFIGNTLGLSKAACLNEPGTPGMVFDSIGAFTTTDSTQTVGSYANLTSGFGSPAGTTLDWKLNSSSAELTLPAGSVILHAELVWSGSFGFYCGNPITGNPMGVDPNCVLDVAAGPIKFTTPDGMTHLITADPTTALESQNPAPDVQPYYCGGNYTRSQDVTALLVLLGSVNGTYTVGAVPATVSALDNSHNAAGWTLAIVYQDDTSPFVNNMALFLGAQQASRASVVAPAAITGFCAQTTPEFQFSRLLVSAIEGDANINGEQMKFGPSVSDLTPLSGPNNPVDNFFSSQINDDQGNLITTTGTYCIFNADPLTGVLIPNGRQGYDITNVDCSSTITSGQTSAFAIASTIGDDFMINALGMQISVVAPGIVPIKYVNSLFATTASIGDTLHFTVVLENKGTTDALDVIFQDTLETGLYFVPGSVAINGFSMPSANPTNGIALGTLVIDDMDIIAFDVVIAAMPPSGNFFVNTGNVNFMYSACVADINTSNNSNVTVITLSTNPPGPNCFVGTVHECKYLSKTLYSLEAVWDPLPLPMMFPYEIFKNGVLIETVPATGPYTFATCLNSPSSAGDYTVVVDYGNGVKSLPIKIRII